MGTNLTKRQKAAKAARRAALASGLQLILRSRDISAFIQKQRVENRRYCGHCGARVKRLKSNLIRCVGCGRSVTVAEFEALNPEGGDPHGQSEEGRQETVLNR